MSFVVRHRGRYLHHNFVVAVLNDLFGIQSRGGCSCAGPYGHRLLGIDLETSHEFEREIARGCEGIKPGWIRVNFNYFISEAVFSFILDAVDLVAREGWRLLPDYAFNPETGLWRHRAGHPEPPLSLHDISLRRRADGLPGAPPPRAGVAPRGLSRRGAHAAGPAAAAARRPDVRRRTPSARTSRTCAGSCSPRTCRARRAARAPRRRATAS